MNVPDLRQLRYFAAVAEELHFGRAAERVGIAQPPLTQQIHKLEAIVGCPLLVRGRKTALTDAGVVLFEEAKRILRQVERAVDLTRRTARGERGQLRIGAPPSVMLSGLPAMIRKYGKRHPDVSFSLQELATSVIEERLGWGEIDVGFLREARPPAPLTSRLVLEEAVVAVLPAAHQLASRKKLKLSALRDCSFVFFPRRLGPAFYDKLISFCTEAGFSPRVVQEATQWQSIVSLVQAGIGVSIAPGCVRRFLWKGVTYRPLPQLTTSVYACWRAESSPPTAAEFLKLIEAEWPVR